MFGNICEIRKGKTVRLHTKLTHCILVDASTVICWTSPFVIILRAPGQFCRIYSIFDGIIESVVLPYMKSKLFGSIEGFLIYQCAKNSN